MFQLEHQHYKMAHQQHQYELVVIALNLNSPENYGMLVRTCEALGVKKIIFLYSEYQELTPIMKRSSRSAEKNIEIEFKTEIQTILNPLTQENYELIALELSSKSVSIQNFKPNQKKLAIFCGNERHGIAQEILEAIPVHIHIPLYGKNSSMNVATATGIALWGIINS